MNPFPDIGDITCMYTPRPRTASYNVKSDRWEKEDTFASMLYTANKHKWKK